MKFRDPHTGLVKAYVSTGETNKTRAERWAEEEFDKMCNQAGSETLTYREWIDRFYKPGCPHMSTQYDSGKSVGETTMKTNRHFIENIILKDSIFDLQLGDIRKADVLDFKDRIVDLKG